MGQRTGTELRLLHSTVVFARVPAFYPSRQRRSSWPGSRCNCAAMPSPPQSRAFGRRQSAGWTGRVVSQPPNEFGGKRAQTRWKRVPSVPRCDCATMTLTVSGVEPLGGGGQGRGHAQTVRRIIMMRRHPMCHSPAMNRPGYGTTPGEPGSSEHSPTRGLKAPEWPPSHSESPISWGVA